MHDLLMTLIFGYMCSSCEEEQVADEGGGGGVLEAARRRDDVGLAARLPRRRRHGAVGPGEPLEGARLVASRRPYRPGDSRGGLLPPRRRRRRREPQQEPRLVDEEQLGVPERAAAGGDRRQGAELRAAVPRRPDRHRQRMNNATTPRPSHIA
jgi:hypothetical protein|uniref:Expressed protein n=1 Tax=Oryza sativa subsp. japonica TaxID=39947 RepID=Q10B91_ORYSJ|nr:expressed protein [Oryza sativa Japonica Group]